MLRTLTISAIAALTVGIGSTVAIAAPDSISKLPAGTMVVATAQPSTPKVEQVADVLAARPTQTVISARDTILYNILSDQISQMRRRSALPTVMCIAASNDDGSARTVSHTLMERLEADNAQFADTLFTLKPATACESSGERLVDRDTHGRAIMIVAGPMESEMKDLMAGCGDYVGGFVRASGDSDFDFYSVNGGDVARKLGCELAQ